MIVASFFGKGKTENCFRLNSVHYNNNSSCFFGVLCGKMFLRGSVWGLGTALGGPALYIALGKKFEALFYFD